MSKATLLNSGIPFTESTATSIHAHSLFQGVSESDPQLDRVSKTLLKLVKHIVQGSYSSRSAPEINGSDKTHGRSQSITDFGMSVSSLYHSTNGAQQTVTSDTRPTDPKIQQIFQYSLRILSSKLRPSVVPDEAHIGDLIKKKLMRENETEKALRFSNLHSKLSSLSILRKKWAILYFLLSISEESSLAVSTASNIEFLSLLSSMPLEQSFSAAGLSRISAPHKISERIVDPAMSRHIGLGSVSTRLNMTSGLGLPQDEPKSMLRPEPEGVPEWMLLRDMIYILQGIDGIYIKFDESAGLVLCDSKAGISNPTRDLIHRISEIGWLYKRVNMFVLQHIENRQCGIVGQSFFSALQRELTEYYRLIAVLESQITKDTSQSQGYPLGTKGLSLKRLLVWTQEWVQRLRLMSVLVDVCAENKGGSLVSTIDNYTNHGDPFIQSFIKNLLSSVSGPFYQMLHHWIYEGELNDPFEEFFVAVDSEVQEEDLWQLKYLMRDNMVPSFLGEGVARKCFSIGRSLNFMRYSCGGEVMDFGEDGEDKLGDRILKYGDMAAVESSIDRTYLSTSRKLLDLLFQKYKLMDHFGALKRYLLLGQGDFIQYLMDSLGTSLDKPANTLFRHNLTGTLETAVRASNAQYDDPDILRRLDVRLLEVSPGDLVWDVFSLDYHVDSPINTVFSPQALHQYLKLFNFLWRLKRVEYSLSGAWRRMVTSGRRFREIDEITPLFHRCRIVCNEMIHFVYQLQYYYLFEVLECSWTDLVNFIQYKCVDLDSLINAHHRYLGGITAKGFLSGANMDLSTRLTKIFTVILEWRIAQDRLHNFAWSELERREKLSRDIDKRTKKGKWGTTDFNDDVDRIPEAKMEDELPRIRKRLEETAEKFTDEVYYILATLKKSSDDDLRSLFTRLDYNDYYGRAP